MPSLPNKPSKLKLKCDLTPSEKSYMIWLASSLIVVLAVLIGLGIYGAGIYQRAISLFNSTNEKIVQKTGLEMSADLNSVAVEQVEKVIDRKIDAPQIPDRARNIFFYNSYIQLNQSAPPETAVTPSPDSGQ